MLYILKEVFYELEICKSDVFNTHSYYPLSICIIYTKVSAHSHLYTLLFYSELTGTFIVMFYSSGTQWPSALKAQWVCQKQNKTKWRLTYITHQWRRRTYPGTKCWLGSMTVYKPNTSKSKKCALVRHIASSWICYFQVSLKNKVF